MRIVRRGVVLLAAWAALGGVAPAAAQSLISRTITVDGDLADWHAAPAIPINGGQSSDDCEADTPCELDTIQSTGRDLRRFAYTWDADNLYFFVERYASANNSNTWLFYLDEDTDGVMETGERIFQVDWWGSNASTEAQLCAYTAVGAAGDPILGDGHTLPGSAADCTGNLYRSNVRGGSANGLEMESRLAWSDLGLSGPSNIGFHISSSRGISLPGHIEDNMVGPGGGGGGGGQLFPPDMSLSIASSSVELGGSEEATIRVTLVNVYYDPFADVRIEVPLPAQLAYVSHSAPAGTAFTDSDGDGRPDTWVVPALNGEEVLVLEVTVRALPLPLEATVVTPAALVSWTGTDSEPANNTGALSMTLLPSPDLMVVKSASAAHPVPGTEVTYTVVVTNTGGAPAEAVQVQGALDPDIALRLGAFGPGVPFQFSDGASPSGLALGPAQFSADGGATWDYLPVSGGGGAPAGHDSSVTHWRIPMSGAMAAAGGSFQIRYVALIR